MRIHFAQFLKFVKSEKLLGLPQSNLKGSIFWCRLYKGIVFVGCQNRTQTFRFIRHTPFRYYLNDKFSLKTFIYLVNMPAICLFSTIKEWCTVFPFPLQVGSWLTVRYSKREHSIFWTDLFLNMAPQSATTFICKQFFLSSKIMQKCVNISN